MILFIGLLAATGVFVYESTRDLPDIGDVKSVIKSQTTYIYASDGTLITRLFQENRTIVPLKNISPTFQKAIISVEDQRFYEHRGVDYIRIAGALIRDIRSLDKSQGGSTITQQYVKYAYFSPEKTVTRKIREAFLATKLERTYTKEEILEKYLNTIYFGNGAYGIEAAAQTYFGIPASKLNVEQSAMLAAVIKAPSSYNPYKDPVKVVKRRNLVIDLMKTQGHISESEAEAAKNRQLVLKPKDSSYQGIAPYFAEWIKSELNKIGFEEKEVYSQGMRIYTTLDPKMQEDAELAWKKYLPSPRDPDVAIVAIEPKTGAVKAMVGGKDFNKQKINLATQGRGRQPGSSFKPFVMAAGLVNGVSPDDGYDATSPKKFTIGGGQVWTVRNSGRSSGFMSLKDATRWSVNVVYAGLITQIGADKVVSMAKKLGVTSDIKPNPAIALGGLTDGVHPIEMASAYATLANKGKRNKPYGIVSIKLSNGEEIYKHKPDPKQTVDEAVAYLVTDALKGVIQGGTGTRAKIGRPAAGKTGTTQNYGDAWFCGYTPDLATAVWVGHHEGQVPMTNVHGIKVMGGTFPAQIWATFMKRALKDVKPHQFDRAPNGSLSSIELCDETNLIPGEFCPKTSSHVFVRKYKPKNIKVCTEHDPIPVPDLTGLTKQEAIDALTKLKLECSVAEKPFSGAPGTVIEQNPAAGTEVKEGTVIEVFIGVAGQEQPGTNRDSVTVPNVVGLSSDEATDMLENKGFVVVGEYRLSDDPANSVVGQRPPSGFIAAPGSTVTIVISGDSGSVMVPNIIGKNELRAREILESKGFSVVVYSDDNSDNIKQYGVGIVSGQSPKARTRVERGSKVTIHVTSPG